MTGYAAVSVVVPVYNDPEGVRDTLECLVSQTYPDEAHEVLVVDNGSTEDRIQGSYAARNRGIRHARGETIAFLDADVTVPNTWLEDAAAAMERLDAEYLACDVELRASRDSLASRFNERSGFPIERYVTELRFAPTCCLLVSRTLLDDVGWFDERLVSGGDLEFGNRVADAGYRLAYAPDVTATHPTRSTATAVAKKAARVGRGRYQLRAHYPERYGTPLTMLCNPLTYLPPQPWRAPGAFEEFESLPGPEKLGMYLLLALAKYARVYGKVTQAVAMGAGPLFRPGRPDGRPERRETATRPGEQPNDSTQP